MLLRLRQVVVLSGDTWWGVCCRSFWAPPQREVEMTPVRIRRRSFVSGSEGCSPSHPEGITALIYMEYIFKYFYLSVFDCLNLQVDCRPAAGLRGSAPEQETSVFPLVLPASRRAWFHICQQRAATSQKRSRVKHRRVSIWMFSVAGN